MGNASTIPYEIDTTSNSYAEGCRWQLHDGKKKKVDDEEFSVEHREVSIFSFKKTADSEEAMQLQLALNGCQRLKSLKHPYVLGFLDSFEMEESFLVATEYAIPIQTWLKTTRADHRSIDLEVLWGLKCIFEALNFLHSKCFITHCNISTLSCFYTKNGDWKLGLFDFACNLSRESQFFDKSLPYQAKEYLAPETSGGNWKSIYIDEVSSNMKEKKCGWQIDIFAMGILLQHLFSEESSLIMPKCFENPLRKMLSNDYRRRPSASSLLKAPCFHTDELNLMSMTSDLQLKPFLECTDSFLLLAEKVDLIPQVVCTFKILPCIGTMLSRSITDFQVRDSREACRRSIQASLDLLGRFGEQQKIDGKTFDRSCSVPIQQLWTFADRAIRTSLLRTLKPLVYLFSKDIVNNKLFDPLLSGFSDSNSKLREDTLKSLLDVVDKLDESHLQDKLVRCVCNLQNDAEASIRTNAVIFLSRISVKLNPAVRNRVLPSSFCKAMKDPFVHCRIASLKATEASMSHFELTHLCTRLLPQISLLLLDKSQDVQKLALRVLESCTQRVKMYYSEKSHNDEMESSNAITGGASSSSSSRAGEWTSWALEGLTKSMEKVTNTDPNCEADIDKTQCSERSLDHKKNNSHSSAKLTTTENDNNEKFGWGKDDMDLDDLLKEPEHINSKLQNKSERRAFSKKTRKEIKTVNVTKLDIDPDEKDNWDDF